ncbi:MAG: hypothetical protein WAW39_18885 [Prosthecobacter sp.]|uniref:hypothetical protein n=1 Tax=Prosthecobacter sp. TaxID=1965333 RepID=UPI003BAFEE85
MKLLCLLALALLFATPCVFAQDIDPALQQAITNALPPAYAGVGALVLVLIAFVFRFFTARKNGLSVVDALLATLKGTNVPTKLPLLIACLCMLTLSSCATSSALIASPFGRALIATADQLGKAVIETTQKVGLEQIILQASAKVSSLKAEGINADPVKEILRGSQISAFTDVIEAAQAKYEQLTGKRFTLPKNPVNVQPVKVLPTAAVEPRQNRLKPGLPYEDGPGCMQLAERIPVYGERVAFVLSTVDVK